ncbi:MAG: septum formation protein Maf [Haloplasmataceae bacterium]|jgi:septum formation protein|nr:septum formation protein Maf [Haloplasmataceae bacterium]
MQLVLASNSPRRKELLKMIGYNFIVDVSNVNETYSNELVPTEIVLYLSRLKAEAVYSRHLDDLIIGSDTIVVCDDKILEKPVDNFNAYEMLKCLSGKTHQVITGVTILSKDFNDSFTSITDVTFYDLTESEINSYIETKEPFDKAGGYGIQGPSAKFVKEIKGDYYTVVGLPIGELNQKLKKIIK